MVSDFIFMMGFILCLFSPQHLLLGSSRRGGVTQRHSTNPLLDQLCLKLSLPHHDSCHDSTSCPHTILNTSISWNSHPQNASYPQHSHIRVFLTPTHTIGFLVLLCLTRISLTSISSQPMISSHSQSRNIRASPSNHHKPYRLDPILRVLGPHVLLLRPSNQSHIQTSKLQTNRS